MIDCQLKDQLLPAVYEVNYCWLLFSTKVAINVLLNCIFLDFINLLSVFLFLLEVWNLGSGSLKSVISFFFSFRIHTIRFFATSHVAAVHSKNLFREINSPPFAFSFLKYWHTEQISYLACLLNSYFSCLTYS